jgi:hypothetical protein
VIVSIIQNSLLQYPGQNDFVGQATPNMAGNSLRLGLKPHWVYEAVQEVLNQAGLDQENVGKESWNLLGEYIQPRSRVFVLCNFVYHRRPGEAGRNFQGKCTLSAVALVCIPLYQSLVGQRGRIYE